MAYRRKRRRKSRFFFRLVVLLAIAGGGYYYYTRYYKTPDTSGPTSATAPSPGSPMTPPGGVLTPPLETTTEPADPQPDLPPVTSRPSAGAVQPILMEPISVPPPEQVEAVYAEGMQSWEAGDLLKARETLNRVLHGAVDAERQRQVREILNQVAEKTLFSPLCAPGETLAEYYVVQQNDTMDRIARRYTVSAELLSAVNGGMNKNFIRVGRQIKVLKGPFHATVAKGAHEMHIYLQNIYVRTYRVALGADNSTPTGKWVVTDRLTNPTWVNPRTGQRVAADDPQNPLGEFWIALDGLEGRALGQSGYGIHGTIDEDSIGTDASMGCVRLANKDIEVVYTMLVPGSTVTIVD